MGFMSGIIFVETCDITEIGNSVYGGINKALRGVSRLKISHNSRVIYGVP